MTDFLTGLAGFLVSVWFGVGAIVAMRRRPPNYAAMDDTELWRRSLDDRDEKAFEALLQRQRRA